MGSHFSHTALKIDLKCIPSHPGVQGGLAPPGGPLTGPTALFNQLTSAVDLQEQLPHMHLIHYLDHFFTAVPLDSPICGHIMETMNGLCRLNNAPTKPEKETLAVWWGMCMYGTLIRQLPMPE